MSELVPGNGPSDSTPDDAPTPEQLALLQYLDLASAGEMTRTQAGALIVRAEADPVSQEQLRAWHREKYRLHQDLFTPPPRSFREARWWQARISPDTLYGYSFQQPSLDQTFVIFEALDRREPGWDREGGPRRETRFMNELATLSPELCKPGCVFPHELPEEGAPEEAPAAPARPALAAPSAPFVPNKYAASPPPFTAPSRPAWTPPVQPPAPTTPPAPEREEEEASPSRRGGAWKWVLLAAVLAAGAGAYFYFGLQPPTLQRGGAKTSASASAPVAATASRQRAIAKYPELGRAGSPLNTRFLVEYRRLEAEHSPLLQQPDWPEQLAARCAENPSPSPAAPAPVVKPTAAAAPTVAAANPPATPAPSATPLPPEAMFVNLEASYQSKVNTSKYNQHGASQTAAVVVDVHSMIRVGAKFVLRCVFFKRPNGRGDLRVVLSKSEKSFELAAGQTYSDAFDSPPVYRGRGATEEFDGWLVQLIPEGSDHFLKQAGSTGTIEELGKQMKF